MSLICSSSVSNTTLSKIGKLFRNCFALGRLAICVTALFLLPTGLLAQNKQYTKNTPDETLRGDARIDSASHALSIQIPLGVYAGRAGLNVPISVTYSSKFRHLDLDGDFQPYDGRPYDLYYLYVDTPDERSVAGWNTSLAPARYELMGEGYDGYSGVNVGQPGGTWPYIQGIARMRVIMGDGSLHELRRNDVPTVSQDPNFFTSGVYYSVDGSQTRFEWGSGSNTLFLPDGSRYVFTGSQEASQFIERNGNSLTYNATLKQWTDTLGRTFTPVFNDPVAPLVIGDQQYTLPSLNGSTLFYTFRWRYLRNPQTNETVLTDPNQELYYAGDSDCTNFHFSPDRFPAVSPSLFTSNNLRNPICAHDRYNPIVLAEIVLPNGKSYRFTYNPWGEIDKFYLPSGGYERYQYDKITPMSYMKAPFGVTNRGITDRWISSDGTSSSEAHWQYGIEYTPAGPYITTMTAPNGTVTKQYLHAHPEIYSWNYPGNQTSGSAPYGFDDARSGRAYEERIYDSNGVMLRRTLTEWTVTGPTIPEGYSGSTRDARVTKQVQIALDTGSSNALTKTTTMEYDADLNLIAAHHYDYASVDLTTGETGAIESMPTGTLLRTEETTFLVNDPNIDATTRAAYRARNLVGLPTSTRIKDGSGNIVAQSAINYDETAFPLLSYGSVTSWIDPGTNVRGNVTTVSRWLSATNNWVQTHMQFDQCGSVRNSWDAKGNQSQIEYSVTYAYAYPTLTRSPVPDATGQSGSTTALLSTTIFDFSSGLPTSATEPNNFTSTMEYNDPLIRATRTVLASGNSAQSQSPIAYDDTNRKITGQSDLNNFNDDGLKSESRYDGLGRTFELRTYEGETNYIAAQTQYDAMGRAFKVSNPFRPWQNDTAVWTTSIFDALGRGISVTTPDGSAVTTVYSGNTITVTDQAGKKRRSVTDGLGRLIRVDEPDSNGNLDVNGAPYQPTSYSYDALDNLTSVTQSTQTRTFVYDSLKRLTSATNPESGTICYGTVTAGQCQANGYDANGNLISKTDARGVVSLYAYDALNRNTSVTYTNDPANTPAVTRIYDGATNGKGKLWKTETSGADGSRTTINSYDALGRPTSQGQQFFAGGVWSQSFTVGATYDKAGHVLTLTYPSGHIATSSYDSAGRTSSFAGTLGDATQRTYSSSIVYSSFGGMTKEQFGTDTPIYNKLFYNSRGQLAEIRESTSYTGASDTTWDRGALINHYGNQGGCWGATCNATDNNGNLRRQEVDIPHADQTYDNFAQFYDYDSLNRLQAVRETHNGGSVQWQQTYTYDRWGNRTIDQVNTWGTGINKKDFTINSINNRLVVPSGQSGIMTYDDAGNLTNDTYTGAGSRIYDAENRMISATDNNSQTANYTYDGDGRRVKRELNGEETWQVYGMAGELLAEYFPRCAWNHAHTVCTIVPRLTNEYGYRNGQLLITTPDANSNQPQFLVTDQLGTARMIFDETGNLANVSRHDYLPFGEELTSGVAGRTTTLGYTAADDVRQKFTQKERDIETGLDYFLARFYSSFQGRFITADTVFFQAAMTIDPQRFNLYAYTRNNPLKFVDPEGEAIELTGNDEERKRQLDAARLAVGKQAGAYLYEDKGKDGKYYIGVYKNGPTGKGKDFKDLNDVAGEFAAVIADRKVATIETVPVGTPVDSGDGKIILAPNDKCNCVPSGTESAFAITLNGADENHFRILLPIAPSGDISKAEIDPIDPVQMSDNRPGKNDWGIIFGHEIGHARAQMTGDPDSNGASLRLENKIRKLRDKNAATRVYHSTKEALKP